MPRCTLFSLLIIGTLALSVGCDGDPATVSESVCSLPAGPSRVACLADAFKATLTSSQVSSLQIPLTLENAKRWSNGTCTTCRNGLLFSTLNEQQLASAKAVIEAATGTASNEGFSEFLQINASEEVLAAKSGSSAYSPGNYTIAFLGTPSTTGTWMLQFGGNQYAQNIIYKNGEIVSTTPSYQAVEPKSWANANGGFAPLANERDMMASMLATFTTAELAVAKIPGPFTDVLMAPGNTSNTMPATKQGIKASTLSIGAQSKVLAAMAPWLNDFDNSTGAILGYNFTNELADTYICFSGSEAGTPNDITTFLKADGDYVRIDGPSVWIEFICKKGTVYTTEIHYRSVMRDHKKDYLGL